MERMTTKPRKCEECGRELKKETEVWLELSNTNGEYYKKIPIGHETQGFFPFGKDCAKRIINKKL